MIRYRDRACGVTRASLIRAARNLHKLGEVTEIRGYRYTSTRSPRDGNPYTTQHEAVLVKGPKGTMRFEGFLWGYGGEGPSGLRQLLQACGIGSHAAARIAHATPRKREDGNDFTINFPVPVPVNPRVIQVI